MANLKKLALHTETLKVLSEMEAQNLGGAQKLSAGTGCPNYCYVPVSMWNQTCNASNVLRVCDTIAL